MSLYVIILGVSYPLQLTPARSYFMNAMGIVKEKKYYNLVFYTLTTVLILFTYLVAISGVKLGLVYTLVGATASTFMCLILPALYYLNLDVEKTIAKTILAFVSFLIGVFVFFTTIISVVYTHTK